MDRVVKYADQLPAEEEVIPETYRWLSYFNLVLLIYGFVLGLFIFVWWLAILLFFVIGLPAGYIAIHLRVWIGGEDGDWYKGTVSTSLIAFGIAFCIALVLLGAIVA